MANYKLDSIDLNAGRSELHNALALTGCEVSCNNLPAGVAVPFVHSHKNNEECYLVLEGDGIFFIDGEELPIKAGSCFPCRSRRPPLPEGRKKRPPLPLHPVRQGQPQRLHHDRRCRRGRRQGPQTQMDVISCSLSTQKNPILPDIPERRTFHGQLQA